MQSKPHYYSSQFGVWTTPRDGSNLGSLHSCCELWLSFSEVSFGWGAQAGALLWWQAMLPDDSAVLAGYSMARGFCCLSDLKQLPGSLTAPPFGTLIPAPMESSQL